MGAYTGSQLRLLTQPDHPTPYLCFFGDYYRDLFKLSHGNLQLDMRWTFHFENWTSSLRMYIISCGFSNSMSIRGALSWADSRVLTRCPPLEFSLSCPLAECRRLSLADTADAEESLLIHRRGYAEMSGRPSTIPAAHP